MFLQAAGRAELRRVRQWVPLLATAANVGYTGESKALDKLERRIARALGERD